MNKIRKSKHFYFFIRSHKEHNHHKEGEKCSHNHNEHEDKHIHSEVQNTVLNVHVKDNLMK